MIAHNTLLSSSTAKRAPASRYYEHAKQRTQLVAYAPMSGSIRRVGIRIMRRFYANVFSLRLLNGMSIKLGVEQPFLTDKGILSLKDIIPSLLHKANLSRLKIRGAYYGHKGTIRYSPLLDVVEEQDVECYEIKLKSRKYCFFANNMLLYSSRTTNGKIRKKSGSRILEGNST